MIADDDPSSFLGTRSRPCGVVRTHSHESHTHCNEGSKSSCERAFDLLNERAIVGGQRTRIDPDYLAG